MTDDLVTWLRAQLDDDERAARAWMPFGNPTARALADVDAKRRILDLHPHRRFASLPEEWPDHWRAEVKQAFPGTAEPYVGCERDAWNSNYEMVEPEWWCETVRLLALPYADREGYRDEWRP